MANGSEKKVQRRRGLAICSGKRNLQRRGLTIASPNFNPFKAFFLQLDWSRPPEMGSVHILVHDRTHKYLLVRIGPDAKEFPGLNKTMGW